jgi:hypothetical protein
MPWSVQKHLVSVNCWLRFNVSEDSVVIMLTF